jgi:D-arabinose 1-dehydrogenase-like Zn-dependent alcohol dehydrogenase
LINGAGGGVGTFAVQIAKSFGAEVTGVDSPSKLDMLRLLGAERDYGFRGGAICPKCHRPFAMHLWGLSLELG